MQHVTAIRTEVADTIFLEHWRTVNAADRDAKLTGNSPTEALVPTSRRPQPTAFDQAQIREIGKNYRLKISHLQNCCRRRFGQGCKRSLGRSLADARLGRDL